MHRHVLEDYLECLWADSGVEFKFLRASSNKEDMNFFRGTSNPRTKTAATTRMPMTRQVVPVTVTGSPVTGTSTFQVTASTSTAGTRQPGPITLKRQRLIILVLLGAIEADSTFVFLLLVTSGIGQHFSGYLVI